MSEQEAHIDAYTFIDHVDTGKRIDEVLRDVFEQNPHTVRFTAQFSGTFIGFVAMLLPGLAEAHELARGAFWEAGMRCETAHIVKASRIMIPEAWKPRRLRPRPGESPGSVRGPRRAGRSIRGAARNGMAEAV